MSLMVHKSKNSQSLKLACCWGMFLEKTSLTLSSASSRQLNFHYLTKDVMNSMVRSWLDTTMSVLEWSPTVELEMLLCMILVYLSITTIVKCSSYRIGMHMIQIFLVMTSLINVLSSLLKLSQFFRS